MKTLLGILLCSLTACGPTSQVAAVRNNATLASNQRPLTATESVLYGFGATGNKDGSAPYANLIESGADFYGTTTAGGAFGFGTIYQLTPAGRGYQETVLYSFGQSGQGDGKYPYGTLLEENGTLYGTTSAGGGTGCGGEGCGAVYSLTPGSNGYTESVLYAFGGGPDDGQAPYGGLLSYGGNLYGTTSKGGTDNDGALYVLTAAGSKYTEQLLYSFENADDGGTPMGALVEYGGLLYGTAATGGSHANGTIFQVSSNGSNLCAFHTFGVQDDGKAPQAGLTLDSTSGSGVLYGTTSSGGPPKLDHGIVFSVNPGSCGPTNNYGDLHNFAGGSDGANPASTITLGSDGVIYGTTVFGGTGGCTQDKKQVGCGTIFQLKPTAKGTYKESILHSFGGQADGDGSYPYGGVLLTGNKKIYGVTSSGGPESIKTCNSSGGCGVVFEVK